MTPRLTRIAAAALCAAPWLAGGGTSGPALADNDPVAVLARNLPAQVQALRRLDGPADSGTGFILIREGARDRLFVRHATGSSTPVIIEIAEVSALDGRVADLRSEADAHGVVAFVDVVTAGHEETTYELFLEKEDPAAYLFQPASN
ncbi:hypothetical protein H1W37_16600 [Stappia taiwanensis]|uniref:Uncharacterized protein n=1 Tax=Stappia taiwanensis TaxID=992267 RepID=A0A838XW80_9HYPH|nr:hypothetical protein [Stappia taiwanensis]MBA4613281.1 hypothetical protein [Stappia taiwanensis]GGE80848.1 hypothetical protein GCM10007285_05690 [Stappia taiwanensis]